MIRISKHTTTLRWLLLAGAVYFLSVSIAHMLEIKVPLLFIYYTVPSYAYQDMIISFLSFGWSIFLFTASYDPVRNRQLVKAILVAGIAAICGLHVINTTTDFQALSPDIRPLVFHLETIGLSVYVGSLILFSYLSRNESLDR